jgi:hypothetical protein
MGDEAVVAHLLWQMKVIATKEVERLPLHTLESFLIDPPNTECNSQKFEEEFRSNVRGRTVSVGSYDCAPKNSSLDTLAVHNTSTSEDSSSTDLISLEHNDWSKQEGFRSKPRAARKKILITKHGKRKTESYIGLTTKSGFVRATLRRKFSWKQYPEVCPLFSSELLKLSPPFIPNLSLFLSILIRFSWRIS